MYFTDRGIDELAERVEALLPALGAHTLDRLDLVQDEDQAATIGELEQLEKAAEEAGGGVVVDVAFDVSLFEHVRGDVRLTGRLSRGGRRSRRRGRR